MEAAMGRAICGGLSDVAYLVLFEYGQVMFPDVCVCAAGACRPKARVSNRHNVHVCMANAIELLQQADSRLQKP